MDSVYWKVIAEEEVHKRMEFFTPDVKCRWKLMPMGDLNSAPTVVLMMIKLQM